MHTLHTPLSFDCSNVVKHVVQKGVKRASATIQCLFTTTFNCNQYAGKVWNYLYSTYYRTPQVDEVRETVVEGWEGRSIHKMSASWVSRAYPARASLDVIQHCL